MNIEEWARIIWIACLIFGAHLLAFCLFKLCYEFGKLCNDVKELKEFIMGKDKK
jgi:hypothetical protein